MASSNPERVRCRVAPSPTGPLHFGTARTALFNWLFARGHGGDFILRIEDTDVERSTKEYESQIIEGLKWLGLDWDEGPGVGLGLTDVGKFGPYRQSERAQIYEKYTKKLLEENKAYRCYCTKEELEAERQAMLSQGMPPKYSGKCKNLVAPPLGREPQVIRFKMPEAIIEFKDLIRDKIKFDMALTGDIAIAKNISTPLYNLAVVIDDFEMQITHVIRGEDHIANTPKQIVLARALGFPSPEFAHLPLILSADRSKLSKRHAETSLVEYRESGFLPAAVVNFMALLGWHPKDNREIFTKEELIKEFDLNRVQKAGAVFNEDKLNWTNSQYIKNSAIEKLLEDIKPLLKKAGIVSDHKTLQKVIETERGRMKNLNDFIKSSDFFFALPDYSPELLIWQGLPRERIKNNIQELLSLLKSIPVKDFKKSDLESAIMPLAEKLGRGAALWPLRAALSGKEASPGPFEIMEILGKEESSRRLDTAIKKL